MSNEISVHPDRESELRQFCKTLTNDYNEAVEDIENLEKTIQSLNSQLLVCKNAAASDAIVEQHKSLLRVADAVAEQQTQLASKQALEKQLDTVLDSALRTVEEYSTLCSSTLGPAVEKSQKVVHRFDVFLTQMTAVHSKQLAQISQIDAEICEKQARVHSHDETVGMQQVHTAQIALLTRDCNEAQRQLHETQTQLHGVQKQLQEAHTQNQLHDSFDQLVKTNKSACKQNEHDEAFVRKLQSDVENIVTEHNQKHNLASEGVGVHEYEEAILRSVMVNISKYNQLELKLSSISEDIKGAQETYLTEASKYEILEMDMTANTLMIAEMKNKIEILKQAHDKMCESNAACATEQETLQHTNTVLNSSIARCNSALADKTVLHETMKQKFDKDTADFSTVLREQSLEIARVNMLHDTVQLELIEKTGLKTKLDSSISWDTSVLEKLKEKKLQIKTDMTAMRQEQHELTEKSRTLEANIENQTSLLREEQDAMSVKHSELVQCTLDCERVQLALIASSENESQVRARVFQVQHQLEDEMTLLLRKQQLSDDIVSVSCDLTHQNTLVQNARDEAFRLDQENTVVLDNIKTLEQDLVYMQENIARYHAMEVETDQLSSKNRDLTDCNETLSYAHSNLDEKISTASERLTQLHAELDELFVKQLDAENTLRTHEENMCKYTQEQTACSELSVQLKIMQSDLIAMSLRKTNLQIEMQQIQDTGQDHLDQIHVFEAQLQSVCTDIETRTCALSEVELNLQEKNAEVVSSDQELQQSMRDREELSQISGQLDEMVQHVATLQSQYEDRQFAVEAQENEFNILTTEFNKCQNNKAALEEEMTSVLFLIQEQQEKRQKISQEIEEMSGEVERLLHIKNDTQLECAEIVRDHEHRVQCAQTLNKALQQDETDMRLRTQVCEQLQIELRSRNDGSVQHLQNLEIEQQNMCENLEANRLALSIYQDKLMHVNVYSQHVGIIVDKMQSLWKLDVDMPSIKNNALVLSQVVLLLEEFMDWFESTFLYQLSMLSSEMMTSQLVTYD
jgi:chromosome segregation ATPase